MKPITGILIFLISSVVSGQTVPAEYCITGEEKKLARMINEYRSKKGLDSIAVSESLSYVARKHVIDLSENIQEVSHSWSDCNYDPSDRDTYPCMWEKPRELTNYPGRGFECAHGGNENYVATAEKAINGWKRSPAHNAVIVNQGIWKQRDWTAIGVGIFKNFAVVWFGSEPDPAGRPQNCQ